MNGLLVTSLGQRARDARLGLGISQAEAADYLGWSQQKYSKVEQGLVERLTLSEVRQLAAYLRVDEYYLFTGKHPHLSMLAMQIDRLELDQWGEQAVLETARREAKRAEEQQARTFDAIERQMLEAGAPPETIHRVVERAREIARATGDVEQSPPARRASPAQEVRES